MGKSSNYDKIKEFINQGIALGIDLTEVLTKLEEANNAAEDGIIRIVLLGSFSDGKTSAIAGLLGKLNDNMKIDVAESSDELTIYRPDGLKEGYEIVDTPGLFGSKEKEIDGTQLKYSEITERYISEAHIVIYVCDAVVPLKDSHKERIKLVLRTFNKLDATIFVINKMDEAGYDLLDPKEFQRGVTIKKENLTKRLTETIGLTEQEKNKLKIVCIAADPKGKGLEFWFNNMENYRQRSHIDDLKCEVDSIIALNDKEDLKESVDYAVLQDVMIKVAKSITIANKQLEEPLNNCAEITKDLKNEIQILKQELNEARQSMSDSLDVLRKSALADIKNTTSKQQLAETIDETLGIENEEVTCYLLIRKINQILSQCAETNNVKIDKTTVVFEDKFKLQEKILTEGIKKSATLLKGASISNTQILGARDIVAKGFKFKPWGATKLAKGLTKGLKIGGAAIAVLMEIRDFYKAHKEQKELAKLQQNLKNEINKLFADQYITFDNDEAYYENFAPSYPKLCKQLADREEELNNMREKNTNLKEYRDKIKIWFGADVEDIEYDEI